MQLLVCLATFIYSMSVCISHVHLRTCTATLNEQLGPIGGSSTDDDLLLMTPEPGSVHSLTPALTPTIHPSMTPAIQWDIGTSYEEKQDALHSSLQPEIGINA